MSYIIKLNHNISLKEGNTRSKIAGFIASFLGGKKTKLKVDNKKTAENIKASLKKIRKYSKDIEDIFDSENVDLSNLPDF